MTRRAITAHAYLADIRRESDRRRRLWHNVFLRLGAAAGILLYILTHFLAWPH